MNINGSSIGATIGIIDKEVLRKRRENQERIAKKKEEGQKEAVKIITDAMEKGISMVDARKEADDVLAVTSKDIVGECLNQVREHIRDTIEENEKKAQELKEKKKKKEERKKEKEEREAIRKGRLVLKQVLIPVVREAAFETEVVAEVGMEEVYRYVMAVDMPTSVDVGDLLDTQA